MRYRWILFFWVKAFEFVEVSEETDLEHEKTNLNSDKPQ
jgi:hypothetical protein